MAFSFAILKAANPLRIAFIQAKFEVVFMTTATIIAGTFSLLY
jgi:hypothetical protein